MRRIPARQIHLDFHTSPDIPGVGCRFDKEQFQKALKTGRVNSITVFAKCHHGYCYYPTRIGEQHPTMVAEYDLTGAMIEAAHEIGVAAPVYITAGWSALDAEMHPEWCMKNKDGSEYTMNYDLNATRSSEKPICSWRQLCIAGGYAQYIYDIAQEVIERYSDLDGLFFDICFQGNACYCDACINGMKARGLDPESEKDARTYYKEKHLEFMDTCRQKLLATHPDATIFFNGGAMMSQPEYHTLHTHIEMEDLPTTFGGYNRMPVRASFMRRYGMEVIGMTGKFHTDWGEFGGYKNPDALKYEALMMAAYGVKCSVGDQMPPDGHMDMETYRIIGTAFEALEQLEPWAYPALSTSDLGLYTSKNVLTNRGIYAMLQEAHIDFESVIPGDDLSRFRALILPDNIIIDDNESQRIRDFIDRGGAVLFGGTSLVRNGVFQIDVGIEFQGPAETKQDYIAVTDKLQLPYGNAPFICYKSGCRTKNIDGEVLADVFEPWFDRTYEHYCSHRNTPYKSQPASYPAIVRKGKTIYLAHELCAMYSENGMQLFREVFIRALRMIYTPKFEIDLPSAGRSHLTLQPEHNRLIFHAAYASPIKRGNTLVLEDMPILKNIGVLVRECRRVTRVRLVPSGEQIAFEQSDKGVMFEIPTLQCYQAVEICLA